VWAVVSWQATTIAVIGLIVGIAVGIAVGEQVWRRFAKNLGVIPVAVVAPG
jgi:small basic protein